MPVGNVNVNGQSWRQVFVDNFPASENIGLGTSCGDPHAFPHASNVAAKWNAYPSGWNGTPSWASYCPERTTSIHDGVMDIWLHSESVNGTVKHLIDAVTPRFTPGGSDRQLYGRYVVRYREPSSFPMFHISWLLWPDSNVWPQNGEIDFPENNTNQTTAYAFMHRMNATSGADQDAYWGTATIGVWHTAVIEWLPSRCTFILDGQTIGTSTSRIPSTSMHYVMQTNGDSGSTVNNTSQGHILIDWVAIYARG
jgi:hypothetical protein